VRWPVGTRTRPLSHVVVRAMATSKTVSGKCAFGISDSLPTKCSAGRQARHSRACVCMRPPERWGAKSPQTVTLRPRRIEFEDVERVCDQSNSRASWLPRRARSGARRNCAWKETLARWNTSCIYRSIAKASLKPLTGRKSIEAPFSWEVREIGLQVCRDDDAERSEQRCREGDTAERPHCAGALPRWGPWPSSRGTDGNPVERGPES